MILLDTDVVVDLLRGLPQALAWFDRLGDEEIILPGYVMMELIQGCSSKAELKTLKKHTHSMTIMWPNPDICDRSLDTYAEVHFSHGVGLLDALIGELAVYLNLPLYTFNQKHYSGIPKLRTVQPYQK